MPTDNDRIERELKQLSWWDGDAPGLWRHVAARAEAQGHSAGAGRLRVLRSRWIWAAGGAAAMIVIMLAMEARQPVGQIGYLEMPWGDGVPGTGRPAIRDDAYLNNHTTEPRLPGFSDPVAGSLRLLLAAAPPRNSGPAPGGWASGLGQPNFAVLADGADPLIEHKVEHSPAPTAKAERPGSDPGERFDQRFTRTITPEQGSGASEQPVETKLVTTRKAFQVPAGKYATLILGAHGRPPMSPVHIELQRYGDKFPVSAGPGTTYFIAFPEGWEVKEGEARVVITSTSSSTPASSSADGFAWGLTARGPVAFPEQAAP